MILKNIIDLIYLIRIFDKEGKKINVEDCHSFKAIFYTTNKNINQTCKYQDGIYTDITIDGDKQYCNINTDSLELMQNGVLRYQFDYSIEDSSFPDEFYNNTLNGDTNYFLSIINNPNQPTGIGDAPTDGKVYGRQNADWTEVSINTNAYYTKTETNDLLDTKADKSTTYTKTEIDTKISEIDVDLSDYYTKENTDDLLDNKANITDVYTKSDTNILLDNKVDKIAGKGLSSNDYTTEEKEKLAGLESSKFKGEFTSYQELIDNIPVADAGSFAYVDEGIDVDTVKYIWDTSDAKWVQQQGQSTTETPASIKEKYESNPDTNAFTDVEKEKLSGIESGAEKNIPVKHKSITININDWIEINGLYETTITDTDVIDNSVIEYGSDESTYSIYKAASFLPAIISNTEGEFTIKCENEPTNKITIIYTIQY